MANADDDRVMTRAKWFPGRVVTFGIDREADVRAVDINERGAEGTSARLLTPGGEATIDTPLPGRGNLANILAATAVALELGVSLSTSRRALRR